MMNEMWLTVDASSSLFLFLFKRKRGIRKRSRVTLTPCGCLFLYRSWSGRSTPNKGRNHQPGLSSLPFQKEKERDRRNRCLGFLSLDTA